MMMTMMRPVFEGTGRQAEGLCRLERRFGNQLVSVSDATGTVTGVGHPQIVPATTLKGHLR